MIAPTDKTLANTEREAMEDAIAMVVIPSENQPSQKTSATSEGVEIETCIPNSDSADQTSCISAPALPEITAKATNDVSEVSLPEVKIKGILREPKYRVRKTIHITTDGATNAMCNNEISTCLNLTNARVGADDSETSSLRHADQDEDANSSLFTSFLWFIAILSVVLLTQGGIFFTSFLWGLYFTMRWFRDSIHEEFHLRRPNPTTMSLNEATRQKNFVPANLLTPFTDLPSSVSTSATSAIPIGSFLTEISPVATDRSKQVRFEEGIKFPTRKFLRQPVPRINKNRPRMMMKKAPPRLMVSDDSFEGDSTWNLDSLMVLRNYMKEQPDRSIADNDGSLPQPSSLSTLGPPTSLSEEFYPANENLTPVEPRLESNPLNASKDEEESSEQHSESEPQDQECPQQTVICFDQSIVEEEDGAYECRYGHIASSQTNDIEEEDEHEMIEDFEEGLFGKEPTSVRNENTRRASRYRRRRPRDSLCFINKTIVAPDCPSIPQCPSDEQDFLQQKIRENFRKAVVLESSSSSQGTPSIVGIIEENQDRPETVFQLPPWKGGNKEARDSSDACIELAPSEDTLSLDTSLSMSKSRFPLNADCECIEPEATDAIQESSSLATGSIDEVDDREHDDSIDAQDEYEEPAAVSVLEDHGNFEDRDRDYGMLPSNVIDAILSENPSDEVEEALGDVQETILSLSHRSDESPIESYAPPLESLTLESISESISMEDENEELPSPFENKENTDVDAIVSSMKIRPETVDEQNSLRSVLSPSNSYNNAAGNNRSSSSSLVTLNSA